MSKGRKRRKKIKTLAARISAIRSRTNSAPQDFGQELVMQRIMIAPPSFRDVTTMDGMIPAAESEAIRKQLLQSPRSKYQDNAQKVHASTRPASQRFVKEKVAPKLETHIRSLPENKTDQTNKKSKVEEQERHSGHKSPHSDLKTERNPNPKSGKKAEKRLSAPAKHSSHSRESIGKKLKKRSGKKELK